MPKETEAKVETDPIDTATTGLNDWLASIHNSPVSRNTPVYSSIHSHVQAITSELNKLKGN
jgi:hypothetical protein